MSLTFGLFTQVSDSGPQGPLVCHSVMWVKLTETLSLDVFCQTLGISMRRNELIQNEMVECCQTSKSKEQKPKNKDYLKHSIYSLIQ